MMSVFNSRRALISLVLIVLLLFTFSYRGLIEVFSQETDWEIHKYVYEEGEEGYPINYKAFAIVVTNPQLVDKVEDIVPKRYWTGSNPPPDEIEDYDENHYKLTWYINREEAEFCCSFPKEQLPTECVKKGYSRNAQDECIFLIILYFYNPDENNVEICNAATAEGDDVHNPGEKVIKSSEDPCVIIPGYEGPPLAELPCPLPPGGGGGVVGDFCFQAKIGDCVVTNADGTPITFKAQNIEIFFTPNPYRNEIYCLDLYNFGEFIGKLIIEDPITGEGYYKQMLYTGLSLSNPESEFYKWLLNQVRDDPEGYMRDGEYHECDIVRPDIPARDSSGEQIDSKGVLELLYELMPGNGEFARLNAVPCPEEEDESANDFSDVGGLDCNEDGVVDIPINNPYNEEPLSF